MALIFSLVVEGILMPLVATFGLVGNCLSIVVFYRKAFQRNFHQLMSFLAFYDLLYIILALTLFSLPQLNPLIHESDLFNHLLPFLLPLAHISLTGSIYFTVSMTIERYITVCHPFFKFSHKICVWKFYIIPIITFSTVFNVPKFFELSVRARPTNISLTDWENSSLKYLEDEYEDNQTFWQIQPTELRLNPDYVKYYLIYSNFIINSLLPFAILIILNYFICKRLSSLSPEHEVHSNSSSTPSYVHRREMLLAHISLVIVFVFIFCHSLKWIPNIWELRQAELGQINIEFPQIVNHIAEVSHLTTLLSSSVNFYIYLLKHNHHLLSGNDQDNSLELYWQ